MRARCPLLRAHRNTQPPHTPTATQAQEAEFGVAVTSPDLEAGPTHPLSLKRTFGSSEPIRVKLYRDHAAWCAHRIAVL